jgi:hypothetical protein
MMWRRKTIEIHVENLSPLAKRNVTEFQTRRVEDDKATAQDPLHIKPDLIYPNVI